MYVQVRKKLLSLQNSKEEEEKEPIPAPTIKLGTPTRFILRYLATLNTVVSINLGKRLAEMSKIGGGPPITGWKGKFMECIMKIQTINMMNWPKKNIGR